MENSILISVKKLLGIYEDDDSFDLDIITHINSVFMSLNQMGVGPDSIFTIEDSDDEWTDFIPISDHRFEAVKSYMGLKVRMMFDPPTGSSVCEAINNVISEYEFRLNLAYEV